MIGYLVWRDNPLGFRDAGAFAALLTAIFGIVSATLLLVAILIHSEELSLQRKELTLQREALILQKDELTRLAVSGEVQLKFGEQRGMSETKSQIVESARRYISSNETYMRRELLNSALESVWNAYMESFSSLMTFVRPIELVYHAPILSPKTGPRPESVILRARSIFFKVKEAAVFIHQLSVGLENRGVLDPLIMLYFDAADAQLEDWFEKSLCSSLGRFDKLNYDETRILIKLVCLRGKTASYLRP